MNERIARLTELTLAGKMFAEPTQTEYDAADLLLPKLEMQSKRICEYILNQEPMLTEYCSERLGALLTDRQATRFAYDAARACVDRHFAENHVEARLESEGQVCAVGALIDYICENQKCDTFFHSSSCVEF